MLDIGRARGRAQLIEHRREFVRVRARALASAFRSLAIEHLFQVSDVANCGAQDLDFRHPFGKPIGIERQRVF